MTTLAFHKRSRGDMGRAFEPCCGGCFDRTHGGRKSSTHQAFLVGCHAAWLCGPCVKQWAVLWVEMGGEQPVTRAYRAKGQRSRKPEPMEMEMAA